MGTTLAFFCLHLLPPSWKGLRRFALVTGVSIAVMVAPLLWYWTKSGEARLTTSSGIHLFHRVVESQRMLAERGQNTHVLLQILDDADPRGWDVFRVVEVLKQKGLDQRQTDRLLQAVSIEAILEAPDEYVLCTLAVAWGQYQQTPWTNLVWYDELGGMPDVANPPVAGFTISCLEWGAAVLQWEGTIWHRVPWLALAGVALLFFLRQWAIMLAMPCIVVAFFVGTAMASIMLSRYSGPMLPFMVALAAVPLHLLVRAIAAGKGWIGELRRRDRSLLTEPREE
jgi:hypothetical protein